MQGLKQRLAQRLRPWFKPRLVYDRERWEREYQYGRWDYLRALDELGHYSVVAGYCKYLRRGGALLDLGCGEGLLLEALDGQSYSRYLGVDISSTAIARAPQGSDDRVGFEIADIGQFVPRETFDIIVFNETLYYLSDPIACLQRYAASLRKDGLFIISMYLHGKDPLWRKIAQHFTIVDTTTVINKKGAEWHCKVVRAPQTANATDSLGIGGTS